MATLTNLDTKIAEVLGLAMAAKETTQRYKGKVEDPDLQQQVERMHDEAAETEERCTQLVDQLDGKKTAVLEKARETKAEAAEMRDTYLGEDADELDVFEFLTMAEAGEVGHWRIVAKMNERAGDPQLRELTEWALPIQERHFAAVCDGSLKLAAEEDPEEEAS